MKIKILAMLLVLLMLTACSAPTETTADSSSLQEGSQSVQGSSQDEASASEPDAEGSEETADNSQGEENTSSATSSEGETDSPEQTSEPSNGESTTEQTSEASATTQPSVKIYENYLAALTIYALVFEYPDFQLEGVYAASIVPMEQKEQSKGVYVVFESFGTKMVAHVSYLPAERTEAGTSDVYSPEVGYAAFEIVDSVPENLTQLQPEDYSEALNQVSMPSMLTR